VQNDDILSFAKLFNDELTLDNISRPRLLSMCKYMNIQPYGTDAYLRYSLRTKLSWYIRTPVDSHATLMEYMYAECGKLVLKTKCLGT
jgi:hypothetical protein